MSVGALVRNSFSLSLSLSLSLFHTFLLLFSCYSLPRLPPAFRSETEATARRKARSQLEKICMPSKRTEREQSERNVGGEGWEEEGELRRPGARCGLALP